MIYITRNYNFNSDEEKAFEIYSDSNCEKLEFKCNYYQMIEILQDTLDELVDNGLITYEDAWNLRNDYIAFNEIAQIYSE